MPGKLCTGKNENSAFNPNQSRVYCEGMAYRASGTAAAKPLTDNPHVAGSAAAVTWDRGWTLANSAAGGNVAKSDLGCCAQVPMVPV